MPKLILKSPYLKCDGKDTVSGYLRYIGTRDGVELVPDGRPATKRQEQLIRALVRDFPDSKELLEYADWEVSRTKAHASAFISTALECNWEQASIRCVSEVHRNTSASGAAGQSRSVR